MTTDTGIEAGSTRSDYHRRVAAEKRALLVSAATELFTAGGYDGTSLAAVAEAAGVSRATLFKQFPTKAALFDAIVTDYWRTGEQVDPAPVGAGAAAVLDHLGRRYVDVLTRPGMADLFRIVIAEAPRFPELGRTHFALGKQPFYDSAVDALADLRTRGELAIDDLDVAATQFLGMISNVVLWPRMLLVDWDPTRAEMERTVAEATATLVARYAPDAP